MSFCLSSTDFSSSANCPWIPVATSRATSWSEGLILPTAASKFFLPSAMIPTTSLRPFSTTSATWSITRSMAFM